MVSQCTKGERPTFMYLNPPLTRTMPNDTLYPEPQSSRSHSHLSPPQSSSEQGVTLTNHFQVSSEEVKYGEEGKTDKIIETLTTIFCLSPLPVFFHRRQGLYLNGQRPIQNVFPIQCVPVTSQTQPPRSLPSVSMLHPSLSKTSSLQSSLVMPVV